jgi:predicted DNA-binding protein (UPF0251 family)
MKPVELLYEEYEAIKLADYDHMNHLEASKLMGVSRATFARIYQSAREKIALTLVESRELKTVYGNAILEGEWYTCKKCHSRFTIPNPNSPNCPLCNNEEIHPINSQQPNS